MEENRSTFSQSKQGKKFLIKKKIQDDVKIPKNLVPIPGIPNVLVSPQQSGQQFYSAEQNQSLVDKRKQDTKKMTSQPSLNMSKQIFQTIKSSDPMIDPIIDQEEIDDSGFMEENSGRHANEVEGPQLKIDKEYIAFLTITGHVGFDNVIVSNNGSASIYYEWKRIHGARKSSHAIQDTNEERFFCHHEQNVINPGERIRFVFSFLSKVTGIFDEEWQLSCEPPTTEPLPTLKLTGGSYIDDGLIDWRKDFQKEIDKEFTLKVATEIVGDIFDNVRTPTPPLPDLDDPEQFKIEFEELNHDQKLWFTKETMNMFNSSKEELQQVLGHKEQWNTDVKVLYEWLSQVDEENDPDLIERKLVIWNDLAKKVPIERSSLYTAVRQQILDIALGIPEISDNLRKELDMWDINWYAPTHDPTEQEIKAKAEELNKNKGEWLKKAKKKKWNEEMEKELTEDYRKKLTERVTQNIQEAAMIIGNDGELLRVQQLMNPQLKWDYFRRLRLDYSYFDSLLRKKTISDIDVEGRRVTIRVHLKLVHGADKLKKEFEETIMKEKEEEEKRLEEERIEKERIAKESKKKGKGKPISQNQQIQKPKSEEKSSSNKWKELKHIDQHCLQEITELIKTLLDRTAKLVIVLVSYDRPYGRNVLTSSTKPLCEWLKTQIEQQVYFSEQSTISNFDELIENGVWQENSVLVMENLFFEPEETKCIIDEFGNVTQTDEPDIEAQTPYRIALPYSPVYIICDKENIFNNQLPSINKIKAENTVLGSNIVKEIHPFIFNLMGMQNHYGTIILGGVITPNKLLALDTLVAYCNSIILLGQIGFAFYCTMNNIHHDSISNITKKVIKQILSCFHDEINYKPPEKLKRISHVSLPNKPRARIICPLDFITAQMPEEEYNPAKPEHLDFILNSINQYKPENSINLDQKQILLDYGPETIETIQNEINQAQRLIWIDSANLGLHQIEQTVVVPDYEAIQLLNKLKEEEAQRELERQERLKDKKGGKQSKKAPKEEAINLDIKTTKDVNVPVFNETNRTIGKILYSMQQEKRDLHEKAPKHGQTLVYNFDQDCVVTIVGTNLEDELNREDFQLLKKKEMDQEFENATKQFDEQQQIQGDEIQQEQLEDKISQSSAALLQERVKIDQVKTYLSDFFVKDSEFVLKVLAGHPMNCLKNIDEYPIQANSEIDEEQYFDIEDQSA